MILVTLIALVVVTVRLFYYLTVQPCGILGCIDHGHIVICPHIPTLYLRMQLWGLTISTESNFWLTHPNQPRRIEPSLWLLSTQLKETFNKYFLKIGTYLAKSVATSFLHKQKPLFAYRRTPNLNDLLVRADVRTKEQRLPPHKTPDAPYPGHEFWGPRGGHF